MHVPEIVSTMVEAAKGPHALANARHVLHGWSGRLGDVADALGYLEGVGGNALQAFYRSPELSLLKVRFPGGRRTPPHDHGGWAAILLLSGAERNTIYRRTGDGGLEYVNEVLLEPGSVLPMAGDAVHVAECVGDGPAIGLHVYGVNVLGVERRMWDPETLEEHGLDWTLYETLARKASAAAKAPLSP